MAGQTTEMISVQTSAREARAAARRGVATGRKTSLLSEPADETWRTMTIEERIAAVREVTLRCAMWSTNGDPEPRLQRSVGRVQRARR